MPYGEMKFDDDESGLPERCSVCGRIDMHDTECPLRYMDLEDFDDEFEEVEGELDE